jgi:hypothetical protein
MYIRLINEFHGREARVRVADLHATLTNSQYTRAASHLCDHARCKCQTVKRILGPTGERVAWHLDGDAQGRATITLDGID